MLLLTAAGSHSQNLTKNQKRKQKKKRHKERVKAAQSRAGVVHREFTVHIEDEANTRQCDAHKNEETIAQLKSFFDAVWEVYEHQSE